jgi:hypothetical protein
MPRRSATEAKMAPSAVPRSLAGEAAKVSLKKEAPTKKRHVSWRSVALRR